MKFKTKLPDLSFSRYQRELELAPCLRRLPRLHWAIPSAFLDKRIKELGANIGEFVKK